jgi:transcriptional regulator of acetoin/glycerol metabolism
MSDLRSVFSARDAVLAEGYVPKHLMPRIRPVILESWRRSLLCGASEPIPTPHATERENASTALRAAADPILLRLSERLCDLDTGVLLADRNAVILRRWVADNSILSALDRVNSTPGFSAAEDLVGTNGVGTVVETGRALQVTGPEHISTALTRFTCVGAPIHHPVTGRLEGVITLSCLSDANHPLLTPLLTSTAQDIEHHMLEQTSVRERMLLDAYLVASKQRRARVAAVGPDLFLAGPQVTGLLRDVDQAMLWEYVRATASGARASDSQFDTFREQFNVASCQPLVSDGEVIGTIVEFAAPRRDTPSRAKVRPARTQVLPGRSASLAQVTAHATRLGASGQSILIEGESGVGKLTLARSILNSAQIAAADVASIDVATSGVLGSAELIQILREHLKRRPTALLLRHLESLPPNASSAFASTLEEFTTPDWTPWIIATMTTGSDEQLRPAPTQRLIDVIGIGRVTIPPLRDRREDVSEAAEVLLKAYRGSRSITLSIAATRFLVRAPWPGNLRQLDTTIRGLVSSVSGSQIQPEDLPLDLQAHAQRRDLTGMQELELNAILDALRRNQGNKIAAATAIGISRSTLYRKLRAYHLDPTHNYF